MPFRRIRKALLIAAAVFLACVCITSIALWIRSYCSYDVVSRVSDSHLTRFDLGTARGELMLEANRVLDSPAKWSSSYTGYSKHPLPAAAFDEGWPVLQRYWSFGPIAYFECDRKVLSVSVKTRAVVIPFWVTTLTSALLAILFIARLRRTTWNGAGFPAQVAKSLDHQRSASLAPPPAQS